MNKEELPKNVWFIKGPFTRFEESMKEIKKTAILNDCIIIDSRYVDKEYIRLRSTENKMPELTLKKVQKTAYELEMEAKDKEIQELKSKLEAPSQMAELMAEIALLKKQMNEKQDEKPKKGRPKKEESQEGDKEE